MKLFGRFRLGQALAVVVLLTTPMFAAASPADTITNPLTAVPDIADGETITLPQAGALALAHSPRLAVFDFERRIRDARAVQADLRPNPELALEVANFMGSGDLAGFGGSEFTLSVAQLFELGGKRAGRREVARFERELAAWDYETVRLEVLSEVAQAFVQVVTAQLRTTLADELIETARQDLAAVERRVQAGAASPIEQTRARIAVTTAEMDRETTALTLAAARIRLSATWGSDQPAFGRAVGNLEQIVPPPAVAALKKRLAANPDIARWATEQSLREASLSLERSLGKIDIVASGGIKHLEESGDNALVAGVALPLPLANRNQGNIQAAALELAQTQKERLAVTTTALARLAAAQAELAASFQAALTLREEILPAAEEAMTTAESAYLKGLFNFTDVLAVRTTYLELQERYIASLAGYHNALATLERIVAGPLTSAENNQERP
ncbi:transporter [bacterium DOLJORAL78_65_58]|nr:MAG: transporter [bacterium DOLZORAL124_64_63]PIE76525.1 MAG: transporter [bacterium DOLJORAL78_65_58]